MMKLLKKKGLRKRVTVSEELTVVMDGGVWSFTCKSVGTAHSTWQAKDRAKGETIKYVQHAFECGVGHEGALYPAHRIHEIKIGVMKIQ